MPDAPRGLADVITRMRNELAQSMFAQAVVVSSTTRGITVTMYGSNSTWPYLHSYTPRVGDVVIMAGSPGSWVCLGTISPT